MNLPKAVSSLTILLLLLIAHGAASRLCFLGIHAHNQNKLATALNSPVSESNHAIDPQILAAVSGPNPGGDAHVLAEGGSMESLALRSGHNSHILAAVSGPNPGGNTLHPQKLSNINNVSSDLEVALKDELPRGPVAPSAPTPDINSMMDAASLKHDAIPQHEDIIVSKHSSPKADPHILAAVYGRNAHILSEDARSGPKLTAISGPIHGGNMENLPQSSRLNRADMEVILKNQLPRGPVPPSAPKPGINSMIDVGFLKHDEIPYHEEIIVSKLPSPKANSHILAAVSGPNPGGNMGSLAQRSGSNPGGNHEANTLKPARILAAVSGPNPGGNMESLAQQSHLTAGHSLGASLDMGILHGRSSVANMSMSDPQDIILCSQQKSVHAFNHDKVSDAFLHSMILGDPSAHMPEFGVAARTSIHL